MNDEIPQHGNSLTGSIVWTVCTTFAHLIAAVVLTGVMVAVVPRYIKAFADFDTALPEMTVLLIQLSNLVVQYFYLFSFGLLVDAAILFALSRLPAGARWLATAWFGAVLLAAIVFLALVSMALCMPTVSLFESLSG